MATLPDFNPPLQKPPATPCPQCANTGLVVRDQTFKPCICPRGRLPGTEHWAGKRIDPEDLVV